MDCSPQAPLSMGILQTRILEWVAMLSSNPGIKPRSLALQAASLPGSPKRTTVVLIALVSTYVGLVAQCFKAMWTFIFSNLFTGGTVHSAESYGNTVVGVSVTVLGVWQTTQKGNQSTYQVLKGVSEPIWSHIFIVCFSFCSVSSEKACLASGASKYLQMNKYKINEWTFR